MVVRVQTLQILEVSNHRDWVETTSWSLDEGMDLYNHLHKICHPPFELGSRQSVLI